MLTNFSQPAFIPDGPMGESIVAVPMQILFSANEYVGHLFAAHIIACKPREMFSSGVRQPPYPGQEMVFRQVAA